MTPSWRNALRIACALPLALSVSACDPDSPYLQTLPTIEIPGFDLSALQVPNLGGFGSFDLGRANIGYNRPKGNGESGQPFSINRTSPGEAVQTTLAALRAAGISDVRASGSTITGRVRSGALQDCGVVVIRNGATQERLPATTPTAVLPVSSGGSVNFIRRQFSGDTRFTIRFGQNASGRPTAAIAETHSGRIAFLDATGRRTLTSGSTNFRHNTRGKFNNDVECVSSRRLRSIVTGADSGQRSAGGLFRP